VGGTEAASPAVGATLRAERERRGLSVEDVARDTFMHLRQVRALEDDRFSGFGGEAYARAFVRTYADHLALDADRLVDAFNTSVAHEPADVVAAPVRRASPPGAPPWGWLVVAAAALLGVLIAVAVASALSGSSSSPRPARTPSGPPTTSSSPPSSGTTSGTTPPRPALTRMAVLAARGPCWLLVRSGSATGPIVYQGTLQSGAAVRFTRRRLWVRLGAPASLDLRINGRLVPGLTGVSPVNLLLTPRGVIAL
jgi:hypothetical protein